jgi:hypothetical protein
MGTARRLRRLLEQRLENADEDVLEREEPLLAYLGDQTAMFFREDDRQ